MRADKSLRVYINLHKRIENIHKTNICFCERQILIKNVFDNVYFNLLPLKYRFSLEEFNKYLENNR